MSYIDESLIEGESVLHRARVSWWSQFGLVLLGVVLLVVIVGVFFLIYVWIKIWSTEVAITNRRVIVKRGWIRRRTEELNLDRVESLQVEQGLMGRFLNFGTILISGTGSGKAKVDDIADPLVFRRKFMEATSRPLVSHSAERHGR